MSEQRRIGYRWNLRTLMAQHNLWKSTELVPLLRARGIDLIAVGPALAGLLVAR